MLITSNDDDWWWATRKITKNIPVTKEYAHDKYSNFLPGRPTSFFYITMDNSIDPSDIKFITFQWAMPVVTVKAEG